MGDHFGIGRYIREVAPRVRQRLPDVRWRWVGTSRADWMDDGCRAPTSFQPWTTPIYNWREHVRAAPGESDPDLWWVPHYNLTPNQAVRQVVTVHDLLPLRFNAGARGRIREWIVRRYLGRIRASVSAVLVNSRFTARELEESGWVDRHRLHVTPLGCAAPAMSAAQTRSEAPPFFVFLGSIKPHKNLRGLLAGWEQAGRRIPERLLIVGQERGFFTGEPELAARCAHFGDRVRFTGFLPDAEVAALLSQATALVQPSLHEGFGLPVLEAMAAGCPVLASDAAALPETGGDAALYFRIGDTADLAEKLVRLSTDAALRDDLRRRGLARAKVYTWDRTADLTAAVLREVLQGKPIQPAR